MLSAVRKPNDYDVRVFINCPFDQKFKPIFDAIMFAIHDLGFRARHALLDDGQVIRIERIAMEIATSRFSLHDMSRVELGDNKLPRFNMPFEAGIAYSVHAMKPQRREHHIGVLDAQPYQYQASISDLAGLDPKAHGNDPEVAVACVRDFLRRKSGVLNLPGADHVWSRYLVFKSALKTAAPKLNLKMSELAEWSYVNDLQTIMADWIKQNPT